MILKFIKDLFKEDDTIIGLYRFKGKFAKQVAFCNENGFKEIDNPFFIKYKFDCFKTNLSGNALLF